MRHRFVRLDKLIVDRKLLESRTLAQEYIEAGGYCRGALCGQARIASIPEVSIKIDVSKKYGSAEELINY